VVAWAGRVEGVVTGEVLTFSVGIRAEPAIDGDEMWVGPMIRFSLVPWCVDPAFSASGVRTHPLRLCPNPRPGASREGRGSRRDAEVQDAADARRFGRVYRRSICWPCFAGGYPKGDDAIRRPPGG